MRRLVFLPVILPFLVCCRQAPPRNPAILDSLLQIRSVAQLKDKYGAENVADLGATDVNGWAATKAILFPDTRQQVEFLWGDPAEKNFGTMVTIAIEKEASKDAPGIAAWKTQSNVYLGIPLSDLKELNGTRFYFDGRDSHGEWKVGDWNKGKLAATTGMAVAMDPGFQFTSHYEENKLFHSDDEEAVKKNPAVYRIALGRPFDSEDEAQRSLTGSTVVETTDPGAASPDYEDEDQDPEEESIDPRTGLPANEERRVSFRKFHRAYIATGQLPLLSLPYDQERSSASLTTTESPAGGFHTTEAFDGQREVVGLLPDTSYYYGVVWRFYHQNYVLPLPETEFETHVTTFSKEGRVIATAATQVRRFDNSNPTSCGGSESDRTSSINADLTFSCIQNIYSCQDDSEEKDHEVEQVSGRIMNDGTIVKE